jgi:hypothetical protein
LTPSEAAPEETLGVGLVSPEGAGMSEHLRHCART